MNERKWAVRIERARTLQPIYPFAAEGLRFYEKVAEAQRQVYGELEGLLGAAKKPRAPRTLRDDELDVAVVAPRFRCFLSAVENAAPSSLAHSAREIRLAGDERAGNLLSRLWQSGRDSAQDDPAPRLLGWIFLQSCAEYLADHSEVPLPDETPSTCPLCSSRPQVGVLRPEGEGGRRSLICALCAHEWKYRRIVCPYCGEENVHKLAVYSAESIPYVRVEACDTCRNYLKSIDLTKDGRAVPVVDELATIPLNLWAAEHGYQKPEPNLLGL